MNLIPQKYMRVECALRYGWQLRNQDDEGAMTGLSNRSAKSNGEGPSGQPPSVQVEPFHCLICLSPRFLRIDSGLGHWCAGVWKDSPSAISACLCFFLGELDSAEVA